MDNVKRLNITSISEIVYCDREYYRGHVNDKLSEYRLFIVKSSVSGKTLEVYYGHRKLRDVLVAKSYPSGRDYPNNKLYLRLSCFGDFRDIFYKNSKGYLVELSQYLRIKEVKVDHSLFEVRWNTNDVSKMVILSIDDESSEFVNLVVSQLIEDVKEDSLTKWESL